VGTKAILYDTHLTTDLDINIQSTVSYRGCSNVRPLSNKLSIVTTWCPKPVGMVTICPHFRLPLIWEPRIEERRRWYDRLWITGNSDQSEELTR